MFTPFYMMMDPTYVLVLIGIGLSLGASIHVQRTFAKYGEYRTKHHITGTDAARLILEEANIRDVVVQPIAGELTDNYNPSNKTLNLSQSVAHSTSVAAVGVAAHECGHALQDYHQYFPLKLRASLVPIVNVGSNLALPLILLGLFVGQKLVTIGIICFATAFVFQLVTLPVEFNASRRALSVLEAQQVLTDSELKMARQVLIAAALTYVASAVAVLLQLLRLILLFGNNNNRD